MLFATTLAACLLTFDPATPFFDITTPHRDCSPALQWLPCRCAEFFRWDPAPRAEWYEIHRKNLNTGGNTIVGITPASRTYWYFKDDGAFPRPGVFYEYRVRGCNRAPRTLLAQCSSELSAPVRYRGAPYACFDGPVEVPCYPGDPVGQ